MIPHRAGVAKSTLSGYEKWEAPDPAEWCARGYAVVNADARGVFDSEGHIRYVIPMKRVSISLFVPYILLYPA